ncbi:MAG TPA: dienelactone hydrolase family protein [Hyphomicrobiaceae bacterium]|jgi:dienelactone hydrolase
MAPRYQLCIVLWFLLLCPVCAGAETAPFPFTLSKPAGDGPFPAVVILHDCSGLGPRSSGMPWRWSSELTQRGYVTVWPDSFTPRSRPKGLCTDPTPPRITFEQRAADAYAALAHLASLPFVDARRIAVMGGSHGGSGTLAAIVDSPANASRTDAHFAAAIALYPACGQSYGGWSVERSSGRRGPITGYAGAFKSLAPLLILIGELDDWTPAEPCRRLAEAAKSAGYPVEIKIYPSAHHSFDSILPVRYVAGRINRNAPTGRGATTGGNAEAWADAIDRVARFLAEHVK